jgi:serine phosphatase RsbU (regulator of sigma subunit)
VMHQTVRRLGNPDFYVTAMVARWRAATATFTWINCGHPSAYLVDPDNQLRELTGREHPALGTGDDERSFEASECELLPGQRLVLVTDGLINRRTQDGGTFGVDGLRRALERADAATAAATAMAIQHAVTDCWSEPLEDDATVVVLAVE